jgi:hypothetical protein
VSVWRREGGKGASECVLCANDLLTLEESTWPGIACVFAVMASTFSRRGTFEYTIKDYNELARLEKPKRNLLPFRHFFNFGIIFF